MKKVVLLFICCTFLLITGCATRPSPEAIESADYGAYPYDYEQIIKDAMVTYLIDPYSAQLHFKGTPQKKFLSKSPLMGGGVKFGWGGFVMVNAKNRMGGYTGATEFIYLIKDGKLINFEESQFINS